MTRSTKYFAGIDPSITNTGVVVLDEHGQVALAFNGKESYARPYKRGAYDIDHYQRQADYIGGKLRPYALRAIAIENYSYGSIHKGLCLGEYGGVLKYVLRQVFPAIQPLLVAPTRNKLFATGNGGAGKDPVKVSAMLDSQALSDLGKKLTDDICDAYFLAKYAWYATMPKQAAQAELGQPLLRTRLELVMSKQEQEE